MLALPGPLYDTSQPIRVAEFQIDLDRIDAPGTAASVWDASVLCCNYLAGKRIEGM